MEIMLDISIERVRVSHLFSCLCCVFCFVVSVLCLVPNVVVAYEMSILDYPFSFCLTFIFIHFDYYNR